ncbi:MAG: hypothetical protein QOJ99_1726 [Bryobacterales bacterium]|jgi:hypothetical protein|nr:hypothetical protein [Bryobacterales bacterium]
MNSAIISALAAFGGSSVGALGPVLSNYVLQRSAAKHELSNRQIAERETLYSDFIKEASRLYAISITHALEDLDQLVSLYALVSRIRLFASQPVVQAAEDFVKQIVMHYGEPNLSVEQIRAAALAAKADPLDRFSFACRKELQDIVRRGLTPVNDSPRRKKWSLV